MKINQLKLHRYPETQNNSLRAWSAADELILSHVEEVISRSKIEQPNCLIINDQFGALTVAMNHFAPKYWTDSYLSTQAIQKNLHANFPTNILATQFEPDYSVIEDNILPNAQNHQRKFDIVIFRVPKHNSLLSFEINQIRHLINDKTLIIAGGMTKEIHNNNIKIFEEQLGKTTTSLAVKKARLIFSEPELLNNSPTTVKSYTLPHYDLQILSLPGVFAREKLDIGTQVLLEYLPEINQDDKVIDLGCGNGVIGAIIAKKNASCHVFLTDESQLAIDSAKLTFKKNALTNGHFFQTDSLAGIETNDFDCILCNPPFHQQNVQTLDIAHTMFKDAAHKLKPSGELRVVANRHLKYQGILNQYFSQVKSISNNPKFTVWLAKNKKVDA